MGAMCYGDHRELQSEYIATLKLEPEEVLLQLRQLRAKNIKQQVYHSEPNPYHDYIEEMTLKNGDIYTGEL